VVPDERADAPTRTGPPATRHSFGTQLRTLRQRAGLSQEALAERAGLGVATLAALEHDQRQRPHPHTLARLADALRLTDAERTAWLDLASGVVPQALTASPSTLDVDGSARRVRLPVPPTPLIGREAEVAEVAGVLGHGPGAARLVTLVGPGGVGKTRLALAVAARLADAYPEGAVFVDLAPLRDARLVPATVSRALGLREGGGRSARELVLEYVAERQVLLVLDNFEHLLGAAPWLAELLAACPRLTLLVTSRVALHLRSEQRLPVEPLATPPPVSVSSLVEIAASPSVRLFVERAQSVAPAFALEANTAEAIGAICRRLDGLPLAIELAAARAGVLGPDMLLRRLQRRLPLLTGGAADLPERQHTLRQTLAWSQDLLGPAEQVLFRRLAVFAGGWTLAAAEGVCAGTQMLAEDVLEPLQALVEHSLVQLATTPDGPRFGLLETVREYAGEQLEMRGEAESVHQRHFEWYLALAESESSELLSPGHIAALARDHDNLRVALGWCLASGEAEKCLRLAVGIYPLWYARGLYSEGRASLGAALALDAAGPVSSLRARALAWDGNLAYVQGDFAAAEARLQQSLEVARYVGDELEEAIAVHLMGNVVRDRGDASHADAWYERALTIERRIGNTLWEGITLARLARTALHQGQTERAVEMANAARMVLREHNYAWGLTLALQTLSAAALSRRDDVTVGQLLQEELALLGDLGHQQGLATSLLTAGHLAHAQGAPQRAAAFYADGLRLAHAAGDRAFILRYLEALAALGVDCWPARAVRLVASAAGAREKLGAQWLPDERERLEADLRPAREHLGADLFAASWAEGLLVSLEEAVADARQLVDDLQGSANSPRLWI